MSIIDRILLKARNSSETQKTGESFAKSLYRSNLTIALSGELGAGKTTWVQGLARGLGLTDTIVSPTFALEQRYGSDILSHIDLYRLSEKQAREFMSRLDPFKGIRVVEWPERTEIPEASILVKLKEIPEGRSIEIDFHDMHIPSADEIQSWIKEVMLPEHIVAHMRTVADMARRVTESLLQQGRCIRPRAVEAAALTHDLLRFVDFETLTGDTYYSPTPIQTSNWTKLLSIYGKPHEAAAEKFLTEKLFPDIGFIVSAHRGLSTDGKMLTKTVEQEALAYADKRAAFDKPVTLDERFNDFIKRYGKGKESEYAKSWKKEMKRIESSLFPDGAPF